MLKDLILKNRSYRRFDGKVKVSIKELEEMVELARLSPIAANLQYLKYILVNTPENNSKVYKTLKWAGALKDWDGPEEEERPTAYIIILKDTEISKMNLWDPGISSQSILLGAVEMGYGGCQFGAINKDELREEFKIQDKYEIAMVIALGKPVEEVVLTDIKEDGTITYYRDENKIHYVPKRKLEDLIIGRC